MKRTLILIAFLAIAGLCFFAQTNPDSEEIKSAVEQYIEGEYMRVPVDDFDTRVNNRISELLSSRLNTLVAFAIAIIGLLSALQLIQTRNTRESLKAQIQAEISDRFNENIEKRLKEIIEKTENSYSLLQSKNEVLQKDLDETVNMLENKFKELVEQKEESDVYLIKNEFATLYQKIVHDNKYIASDGDRAEKLLEDVEKHNQTGLIKDVVNMLSYVYYDHQKYTKIIELMDRYKDKVTLHYNTYINASLTAIRDYLSFSSNKQRDKAIEYLNRSLELRPGYGEAHALKLEIFMMDFAKKSEDSSKKEALSSAGDALQEIISSDSGAPSSETINRLNRDNKIPAYKKYIDLLYQNFPKEMDEIFKKAQDYNQKAGLN